MTGKHVMDLEHDVEVTFTNSEELILVCRCGWEHVYPDTAPSQRVMEIYRLSMKHIRGVK